MKKITVAILIAIFVFGLVGCSTIQTKLDTPINVRVEDGVLKWSSVDGATEYLIMIDLEEKKSSEISFDLRNVPNIKEGQEYTIKIKAKSDNPLMTPSDFSDPITWVATISSGSNNNNYMPPENLEEVDDNVLATELFETGLGMGVNALSASSAVGGARKVTIFSDGAFDAADLGSYKVGSSRGSSTSKEDISSVVSSYNAKITYGNEASASYAGMFTAGFETKFNIEGGYDSSQKQNQFYYIINHYYTGKNYQIKGYQHPALFDGKLSDMFLLDLAKVQDGSMLPGTFFEIYGTHLVMAVSYGAMLEMYYSAFSTEKIDTVKLAADLSVDLSAAFEFSMVSASAGTSFSASTDIMENYTSGNCRKDLYIATTGGTSELKVSSFSALGDSYAGWVESLSNSDSLSVTDVADGGLVPIWHYFSEEYSEAAAILKNYFIQQAKLKADSLAAKMKPEELIDEGDIVNFAGGYGTKESPYLIQTVEHFKNINKNLRAHYKLMNDVDLGDNWTPIGQYYFEKTGDLNSPYVNAFPGSKVFRGVFDGNNHMIAYGITRDSFDSNKICFAYGLFGAIDGATVKNLKVEVSINFDATDKKKCSMIYIGGIVGHAYNSTILNCSVLGSIKGMNLSDDYGGVNTYSGAQRIGGIAGYAAKTTFKGNRNFAMIVSHCYQAFAGGICGGIDSWDGSSGNYGKANGQGQIITASKGDWVYGYACAAELGPYLTDRGTYTRDYY